MLQANKRLDTLLLRTLKAIGRSKQKDKFLTRVVSLNPAHEEHIPLISTAYDFSAAAHRDQYRENNQRPYHSHCRGVGLLLAQEFPSLYVAAGLLHDVIEDTPITIDQIIAEFGISIAGMVAVMTELPTDCLLGNPGGKIKHIKRIVTTARGFATPIALADKLYNLRDPLTPEWHTRTSEYVSEYLLFSIRGLMSPMGKPYDEHALYQALVHEVEPVFFPPLSESA
ncbi:HD domain-containing protein [Candidatus Woesearchaeota archaeon]|nr:HD domain-containing protein [Candidatus Woesearchaeota archaeon]